MYHILYWIDNNEMMLAYPAAACMHIEAMCKHCFIRYQDSSIANFGICGGPVTNPLRILRHDCISHLKSNKIFFKDLLGIQILRCTSTEIRGVGGGISRYISDLWFYIYYILLNPSLSTLHIKKIFQGEKPETLPS